MTEKLLQAVEKHLEDKVLSTRQYLDEITVEVSKENLLLVLSTLSDHDDFQFEQLIDLCGVDYLTYGQDEWSTSEATSSGFERGRESIQPSQTWDKPRYAVVYHLLSVTLNHRIRVRVFVEEDMMIPSVVEIWNGANWFEREAFDLFGILFEGHPDLRRILTDYGFIGHPFRKDFPVIGELEMRYDEEQKQCIYEPVTIEERVSVPKVIRKETTGPVN
ncbi:NADH-quinone oxidoreductase subunit C [Aliikangiella coralliicola]|uniref:NADH-quinone oxidoreductase subunit C n=1 Tax=Aliikangiella coralliicola TaxID=2592383 RepID=A0A545UEC6_9GAMM|nr:NADH-quinone oxidoreductase subunit C [Aliikangiella coralliicola]TQV87834.1 NADH-quinone oxidoreductase subunit C [Aliikangiella coralliicola]